MKAAYIQQFGGPEVLQYGDLPDPSAGPGQVVVDIFAASVNGADWKVRAGSYGQAKFPLGLGRDFSGVVSALGAGVGDLRIGDEVFGVLEAGRDGTYAEKVAIGAAVVTKKPSALSHVDAAALAHAMRAMLMLVVLGVVVWLLRASWTRWRPRRKNPEIESAGIGCCKRLAMGLVA